MKKREKDCYRCGTKGTEYYTVQVYRGEPLRIGLADVDEVLCPDCREKLGAWLKGEA